MKDFNVKNAWWWWGYSKWLQRSYPSPRLFAKCLSHSRGVQVLSKYVFSQQNRWDLKVNSIIQHTTKQKWILTVPRGAIPGCQREPAFGGFDPTTFAGWSSTPEPDSATAASARGGTVLKTSAIFMFPFLRFAVLFLLWLGRPSTLGLAVPEAKGLPTRALKFYSMVCFKCCTAKKEFQAMNA